MSKKKKLDKVKMVKDKSRELLGSPKPSRAHGGTKPRYVKNYLIQAQEDAENRLQKASYVRITNHTLTPHQRTDGTAPVLAQKPFGTPVASAGKIKIQERPYTRVGEVTGFSDEVKAHANFLLHHKGEAAMANYLNEERKRMGSVMEFTDKNKPSPTNGSAGATPAVGSVEGALRDCESRIKMLRVRVHETNTELTRQLQVHSKLCDALEIITGKKIARLTDTTTPSTSPMSPDHPRTMKARGFWGEEMLKISNDLGPLSQEDFRAVMQKRHPESTKGSIDQTWYKAKNSDLVVYLGEGKFAHKDWAGAESPTKGAEDVENETK